jgi:hypothetical protein
MRTTSYSASQLGHLNLVGVCMKGVNHNVEKRGRPTSLTKVIKLTGRVKTTTHPRSLTLKEAPAGSNAPPEKQVYPCWEAQTHQLRRSE